RRANRARASAVRSPSLRHLLCYVGACGRVPSGSRQSLQRERGYAVRSDWGTDGASMPMPFPGPSERSTGSASLTLAPFGDFFQATGDRLRATEYGRLGYGLQTPATSPADNWELHLSA